MAVIPKEQLSGFQRWQINSFDQKPVISPPVETAAAPVPQEEVITSVETTEEIKLPTAEEIEKIHEEARKTGYEAGLEEGKAEAEKQCEELVRNATQTMELLVKNVESSIAELDQSVANQLLQLALEIARQLTAGIIKADTDILLPIIKESIATLPMHHAHVTIHLNPADAALVRTGLGEQTPQNSLQIHETKDISPGGCRLTSGTSEVDATIETRWSRVLEAIGAEPQAWLIKK